MELKDDVRNDHRDICSWTERLGVRVALGGKRELAANRPCLILRHVISFHKKALRENLQDIFAASQYSFRHALVEGSCYT